MDRIKDISKVTLQMHSVLLKMYEKGIIQIVSDEKSGPQFDYCIVVAKGANVTSIDIGDVVLEIGKARMYEYKGEKYVLCNYMDITVAVKPDNFDKTVQQSTLIKN